MKFMDQLLINWQLSLEVYSTIEGILRGHTYK